MSITLSLTVLVFAGCPTSEDSPPIAETGMPDPQPEDPIDAPPDDTTPELMGTEGEVQKVLMGFGDDYPGYSDAAGRLLDAYMGGSPDGVTLSPPAPTRTGTVQVDVDLDGTFDEDWDVMLSQPEGEGGPVQVFAGTGSYSDPTSTEISVEMSSDGEMANANDASISVFGDDVTIHGSYGAFQFEAGPDAGTSAGQMGFVAYTSNPSDETRTGVLELVADGMGGYTLQAQFDDTTLRGAPVSVPLACHCYGYSCNQGSTPATFLTLSALIGLIASRRRTLR